MFSKIVCKRKTNKEVINNKMLLLTDDMKRTVWHVSAEKSNVEDLEKV